MEQEQSPLLNNVEEISSRYRVVHEEFEKAIKELYEKHDIEPLELTIFLNMLLGAQLNRVMKEYVGLTDKDIDKIVHGYIDHYQSKMDQTNLIDSIVSHQKALGIDLFRLDHAIKQIHKEGT